MELVDDDASFHYRIREHLLGFSDFLYRPEALRSNTRTRQSLGPRSRGPMRRLLPINNKCASQPGTVR